MMSSPSMPASSSKNKNNIILLIGNTILIKIWNYQNMFVSLQSNYEKTIEAWNNRNVTVILTTSTASM